MLNRSKTLVSILCLSNLSLVSCVTEEVIEPKPAYTYTVINENKAEPFQESPCKLQSEYGISRIGIGYEGINSVFVCSGAPLRKLGPNRYVADIGYPMAIAMKGDSVPSFALTRSASEETAYILDYSSQSGIRIFHPLAREAVTGQEPVYLSLVGQTIECEKEKCVLRDQWICTVDKNDLAKYTSFVQSLPATSPFKIMNERNLQKAKELGCFKS